MPLVIPPGYASAAFVHSSVNGTQPFVTTVGVDLTDWGGSFVDAANFAFNAYDATILREVDTVVRLEKVVLTIGTDGGGTGSVESTLPSAGGARAVDDAPVAMAAIARKVTNLLGRRGRGRMFIPGSIGEGDVLGDGSLVGGRVTELNVELQNFLESMNDVEDLGDALTLVLLHSSGGPLVPTPVEALVTSPLVGWIRGRIR